MTLGTAKRQLEEFERAIRMSYISHRDDITINQHSQFVSALEDRISIVEAALKESFKVDVKKSFHWVNLDEEECDDLALFLSRSLGTSQRSADEEVETSLHNKKNSRKEGSNLGSVVSSTLQSTDEGRVLKKLLQSMRTPTASKSKKNVNLWRHERVLAFNLIELLVIVGRGVHHT